MGNSGPEDNVFLGIAESGDLSLLCGANLS